MTIIGISYVQFSCVDSDNALFSCHAGSLTTIFQVFLGYQAGQIIVSHANDNQRLVRFLIWSLVTSAVGIGLCGASKNEGLVPLNKNLW